MGEENDPFMMFKPCSSLRKFPVMSSAPARMIKAAILLNQILKGDMLGSVKMCFHSEKKRSQLVIML